MKWFNLFGLLFMIAIMLPNVIYAVKNKDGFKNIFQNRFVLAAEQIGRFGCLCFMIINIPNTWFGWWSDEAFASYLVVNTVLILIYFGVWILCSEKNSVFKALALSIIPSVIFLFSGIMSRSVLLLISAVIFSPCHIAVSYKNAK